MKVYVCYRDYDYEGCTKPEAVFVIESDAIKWGAECLKWSLISTPKYQEFEVQVEVPSGPLPES